MNFKLTTFLLFSLALIVLTSAQNVGKCGRERSRAFDTCANKLFVVGNKDARFPEDMSQANIWCSEAKEAIRCIKDFSKQCLTSLTRQVNNLLAYGANKHVKKVCKSKQSRTEAYQNLQCLNRNYDNLNAEMATLIDNYQKSIGSNTTQRIPALCCKFTEFRQRANVESRKTCTAEETLYFDGFISSFASDIMDLLCASFIQDSEKCLNIFLPDKEVAMRRSMSPMPPLLVAMSTI